MKFKSIILSLGLVAAMSSMAVAKTPVQVLPKGAQPATLAAHRAHLTPGLRKGAPTRAIELEIIDSVVGDRRILTERGTAYFDYNGDEYIMSFQDRATHAVIVGNEVYVKNPVCQLPTDSYIKGTKDGDKITFSFPQMVYEEWDSGYLYQYYANRMVIGKDKEGQNTMFVDTQSSTISFEFDGDEWVMESPQQETIIGITDENGVWTGFGDEDLVLSEFTELPMYAPEGEPMRFAKVANKDGHWVNVWKEGDDYIFEGFFRSLPYSCVKGTVTEDGKFVIPNVQYMGVTDGYHVYFMAGEKKKQLDLSGKEIEVDSFLPQADFDYDKENEVFKLADGQYCYLNSGAEYPLVYEAITNLRISAQKNIQTFVPATPQIIFITPKRTHEGVYEDAEFRFVIPVLNEFDELLDSENIFYQIYKDEDVIEICKSPFSEAGPFTEVPYGATDYWDLWINALNPSEHALYIYEFDYERMGVQSLYLNPDGSKSYSEIAYIKNPGDKVESVEMDKCVKSIVSYDLNGMKVDNTAKGIYIERHEFTDGTFKNVKVIRK